MAETQVFELNERVEVCGGSKRWVPGVVIGVEQALYRVQLDKPMLASTWEGRPRRIDGNVTEVSIHRTGFEANNIRGRSTTA